MKPSARLARLNAGGPWCAECGAIEPTACVCPSGLDALHAELASARNAKSMANEAMDRAERAMNEAQAAWNVAAERASAAADAIARIEHNA